VRRAYARVLVTAHVEHGNIVVFGINDTQRKVSGTLDVERMEMRGKADLLKTGHVDIPADASLELARLPIGQNDGFDPTRHLVWVNFYGSIYASSNALLLQPVKELDLSTPDISVEVETDQYDGESRVRLTSPVFVRGVWLSTAGPEGRFSDNAFDLIPYVSREVTVTFPEGQKPESIESVLKIQHCNPP
jgi:hypothetical protein